MPFSARARSAVRKSVVAATATAALLGIAGTAGATTSQDYGTTASVGARSAITVACSNCWTAS